MSTGEFSFHKEKLNKNKIKLVGFISFLLGFGQAMLIYIMSSYFKIASGTENVGIFYFAAYVVELVILLNLHKIVSAFGKSRVFIFSVACKIPLLFLLALLPTSYLSIIPLILYVIVSSLSWVGLDIILEFFSVDRLSGRIRGLHLTIMNTGFLLGPFLSTRILGQFDFPGIFIFLIILYSFMLVVALVGFRDIRESASFQPTIRELFFKVIKRKNVMRAYYVSFTLDFFYALMVIFTPLYLRDLGLSWDQIGIIFTVMLVPFVLLQYPAGLIADKRTGEKELLIFSIIILGASTLLVYFTGATGVVIWAVLLFATRIGASLVELLRDSYFYKRIDSCDIYLINFFRTSRSVAFIAASALSTVILLLFPLKAIFLLVALVSFSALYPVIRMVDNKCEREMNCAESAN